MVNASWVAVQELEKIGLGDNVNLITVEVPVEYDTVTTSVPSLWQQYKPKVPIFILFFNIYNKYVELKHIYLFSQFFFPVRVDFACFVFKVEMLILIFHCKVMFSWEM